MKGRTRHAVRMRTRTRAAKTTAIAYLASACVMFLAGFAHSQDHYHDVPPHSHYSATEQGWTCDDGFRQVAGFCVQDTADVPSQGPFEVFDGQWRCRSGYKREASGLCVTPTAPAHATIVELGGRWECDWGFRKVGPRCEEITPPAHAYLDASGQDWVCYPGYQRNSDHCVRTATGAPEKPAVASPSVEEPKSGGDSQGATGH